jgi:cysteinyl-tRNA synthetase
MKIYNTLTGRKEEFIPLSVNEVKIYACGVTVYDYCHIGHARSAIVFDVMRKYFQHKGFQVTYVRNFTDIDDKIINRARQEGIPWDTVAQKYTDEYYADMDRLGVGRADIEPKATEYIGEIIAIVQKLIEGGFAYEIDGSVYYSVEAFPEYGKLSKRDKDEMVAGARIEVDERKRNPLDFALWKKSKADEPFWESPWGKGRPGWHIECTAMSMQHLGESFDIHGGGADLLFPHHENEIAQSEAATGKPFAKYWVHNGFITIDKEKMSKSLGNFFTIREVLDRFDPEVVRFFLLSTHYRSPIEFSDAQLNEAEASLDKYYTTLMRIQDFAGQKMDSEGALSKAGEFFSELCTSFPGKFEEAMDDDFNTALAIGHIFEFVRELNRLLDTMPSSVRDKELILTAQERIKEAGAILHLFGRTPREWYSSLMKVKGIGLSEAEIHHKITDRQAARRRKDWKLADAIRQELEEKGIILEDTKERTGWKVRAG